MENAASQAGAALQTPMSASIAEGVESCAKARGDTTAKTIRKSGSMNRTDMNRGYRFTVNTPSLLHRAVIRITRFPM